MFNKKQSLEKIASYSSHLAGRLARHEGPLDHGMLADVFLLAIENGGLLEQDFIRVEGQNYNPRPARIALILLDCGVMITSDLLAAGFIASAQIDNSVFLAYPQALAISLDAISSSPLSEEGKILALALHLDRARHFHQSQKSKDMKEDKSFCDITKKFIELAEVNNTNLFNYLSHWLSRHERNRQKHIANQNSRIKPS